VQKGNKGKKNVVNEKVERMEFYMNKVILIGRLTRDPEVRYSQGAEPTAIARYTLAIDRRFKRDGEATADFINCVCFGKSAEFAEKYLSKGMKIAITGRIQTGSYTNREGQKVYTTDIVVEEQEFCESKSNGSETQPASQPASEDGFMPIPSNFEELPFN
jgi:single-strand DNA-binding protein